MSHEAKSQTGTEKFSPPFANVAVVIAHFRYVDGIARMRYLITSAMRRCPSGFGCRRSSFALLKHFTNESLVG